MIIDRAMFFDGDRHSCLGVVAIERLRQREEGALGQLRKVLRQVAAWSARDDDGQTALMTISDAQAEDVKLTALLPKHGADPHARDRRGMTAIDRAARNGYAAALTLLTRPPSELPRALTGRPDRAEPLCRDGNRDSA